MNLPTVLICGTSDHATACALRLFRAGLKLTMLSPNSPFDLHHHRTFTRAVHLGHKQIDGITARTWSDAVEQKLVPLHGALNDFIELVHLNHDIPIVLSQEMKRGFYFSADFVVFTDDVMVETALQHLDEKTVLINLQDISLSNSHYQIATTPLFLGRVVYPFNKEMFETALVKKTETHVTLKAPQDGVFQSTKEIGQTVFKGEALGIIDETPIPSPLNGMISGQINSGLFVTAGQKLVEVSSEQSKETTRHLPVESFAIAGGVLEAVFYHWHRIREVSEKKVHS